MAQFSHLCIQGEAVCASRPLILTVHHVNIKHYILFTRAKLQQEPCPHGTLCASMEDK
uniref:Uncharacterized protein n=1 Tax=Anguilla anguilla TaxID=7936 RepID=A0A0E9W108_ANGAN